MADLTITAANVVADAGGVILYGTAGADGITQGMSVYPDASDGSIKKAQADTTAHAKCSGIALNAASTGQPVAYLKSGNITIGATVTVGEEYVVSNTAGAICPLSDLTTGQYVTSLGLAISTTKIAIQIQQGGVAVP